MTPKQFLDSWNKLLELLQDVNNLMLLLTKVVPAPFLFAKPRLALQICLTAILTGSLKLAKGQGGLILERLNFVLSLAGLDSAHIFGFDESS